MEKAAKVRHSAKLILKRGTERGQFSSATANPVISGKYIFGS